MFDNYPNENKPNPENNAPALNNGPAIPIVKSNQPSAAIEDMFAETEKKEKPPVFQKKPETDFGLEENDDQARPNHQKIFFLIFLVLALILIGIGGVWGYRYIMDRNKDNAENKAILENNTASPENTLENSPVQHNDTPNEIVNGEENINNIENITQLEGGTIEGSTTEETSPTDNNQLDSDGDGLTDEEEWQMGTAVDSVDTDNDGLFDREEVKAYGTDPKNPDSDGDSFADGAEVKGRYNPMGSGKLFDANK